MTVDNGKMQWWRHAKYGMFIHWGLYAIPAGRWKGGIIPSGGEWIMKNGRIPLDEYKKLANEFNPVKFNAVEWVKLAVDSGMKYLVFTAKHHDGFAMYDSAVSDYNIVKATPCGRDVLKELAAECDKQGITFGLYYSQYQDWEDMDGFGNDWDYNPSGQNFRAYFDRKVKPQLTELLTNYGPIGLLWFDTPYEMPRELCEELVEHVRSIQPGCIINGRIGYYLGDYRQMGDNSIPVVSYDCDWETPMTLNDTWGYKDYDHNYKSPETVLKMLINVAGKCGNFLINIGPDAEGGISTESIRILKTVGEWLKVNGDSVYGVKAFPDLPYELDWGRFTYKDKKMYMHVFNWPLSPCQILVYGFKTKVNKAYLLSDKAKRELKAVQTFETARDQHRLRVNLPEEPVDRLDTVVVLELDGEPEVYNI